MTQKSALYWSPMGHLNAAYALRHQAPQLVGRLPRERTNGFLAAARMAHKASLKAPKMPRMPNPLGPKSPLATPSLGALAKPAQPVIPRQGPPIFGGPPAGSAMPQVNASPLGKVNLGSDLPKMPGGAIAPKVKKPRL